MIRFFVFVIVVTLSLTSCDMATKKSIYNSKIKADSIIVDKSEHSLYLLKNGKVIRDYNARFGFNPVGDKVYEGDGRTPEGKYHITHKNYNSKYFLSLLVSYPNDEDSLTAQKIGKNPGGAIMVHGQPNEAGWLERMKNKNRDWTFGCIALSNNDMVNVYSMVTVNTPILIRR
jgi:murein L,D-transpeptidase YafK